MTLTVNINTLDKSAQKELRKAFYAFKGKGTVQQLRSRLVFGKGAALFFAVLTFLFLAGLGLLFIPLLFVAPFALLVVPFKVRKDNDKWNTVLPADQPDAVVVLV